MKRLRISIFFYQLQSCFTLTNALILVTLAKAIAAVGQGRLMSLYDDLFSQFNQPIAQILLTKNDLADESSRLLDSVSYIAIVLGKWIASDEPKCFALLYNRGHNTSTRATQSKPCWRWMWFPSSTRTTQLVFLRSGSVRTTHSQPLQ